MAKLYTAFLLLVPSGFHAPCYLHLSLYYSFCFFVISTSVPTHGMQLQPPTNFFIISLAHNALLYLMVSPVAHILSFTSQICLPGSLLHNKFPRIKALIKPALTCLCGGLQAKTQGSCGLAGFGSAAPSLVQAAYPLE